MREEVESRPLVAALIGLVVGLLAVALPPVLLILGGVLVAVRPLAARLWLAIAFGVGLLIAPTVTKPIDEATPIHGIGTVASAPKIRVGGQTFNVRLGTRTLEVMTGAAPVFSLGDEVRVSGIELPSTPDREPYQVVMGIEGRVEMPSIERLREGPWLVRLADGWRESSIEFFDRTLPPQSARMIDAITFGAGSIVDPSDSRKLKQSGLIHIVTASGLQVFVLAFLLFQLLRFLPASRPAQIVVVASILCLYALAAGLNPAVVRASVMSILALSAHLFRREPDALSSLALAGIGYLLWNPHAVYSPGFALSFVTVACVALFFKRAPIDLSDRRQLLLRWSNDFLCLSWVICVAALPLSAYYFGVVSAVSVLSNLLVAWCTPLLVGGSILTYVLSTVLPTVAAAISSHILGPLSQWVLTVLDWTGGEGSSLNLPPFSGYWLVLFYGALILTVRRRVVQP